MPPPRLPACSGATAHVTSYSRVTARCSASQPCVQPARQPATQRASPQLRRGTSPSPAFQPTCREEAASVVPQVQDVALRPTPLQLPNGIPHLQPPEQAAPQPPGELAGRPEQLPSQGHRGTCTHSVAAAPLLHAHCYMQIPNERSSHPHAELPLPRQEDHHPLAPIHAGLSRSQNRRSGTKEGPHSHSRPSAC